MSDRPLQGQDVDDERFFRDYSKALAQALLENEDGGGNRKISKEDAVKDAYIALCHDDPRVDSDEACRLLALSLTKERTSANCYALSERLVEGIRQATLRTSQTAASSTEPVDTGEQKQQEAATSLLTISAASTAGYASVAVAAFVKVPLACCQCSEKAKIERYLGSYRGPARQDEQVDADLNKPAIVVPLNHPLMSEQSSQADEASDYDSLEEIWADESDPDDFEYESAHADGGQPFGFQDSVFAELDPVILSRPPTTSTLTDLRHAVANLLIELNYSKLAFLSLQQWKTLRLSDVLTQLALTLLVPPPPDSVDSCPLLLKDEDEPACDELRRLGVQPLFCLRDRAMDLSSRKQQHGEDAAALNDYLVLVQTLLGVDAVLLQSSNTIQPPPLAPATVIGMASLSALCASSECIKNKLMRSKIRKCLLENMEDLASIAERSSPSKTKTDIEDDGVVSWVRFILALLPVLHVVTGILADGTSAQAEGAAVKLQLSKAEAQIMLNSGFFRQAILLCTGTNEDGVSSATSAFARTQLLRAILVLSIQSTSLLGKYAWRVPELARLLSRKEWRQSQPLDSIMWLLLGETVLLANSGSGGVRLRLKSAAATATLVPTVESCRQDAMDNFYDICQRLIQALNGLRELRERAETNKTMDWKKQHEETVMEFTRLTNLLVSCTSFATLWLDSVSAGESTAAVKNHLQEIREVVSSMPPAKSVSKELKNKDVPKKTAENDKAGTPIAGVIDTNEEHVTNVKKGLKVLALLLQEGAVQKGSSVSSKTD